MKTFFAWTLMLWFALVLENARPDLFPSCSLILPLAVGCIYWLQNGMAIALTGTALLARWLLHPSVMPIEVVVTLVGAAAFFSPAKRNRKPLPATSRSGQIRWLAPMVVTVIALSAHSLLEAQLLPRLTVLLLSPRLIIAGPCTCAVVFAAGIADEFGLRRVSRPV